MTALHDAPVLIVFADLAEKHCSAGWYAEIDAARARRKGIDLGLTLIENLSEQVRAFALTLPRGRFLADSKLHLDLVSREVIDRLLALRAADQPKGEKGNLEPGAVRTSSPGKTDVLASQVPKSTPVSGPGPAKTHDGKESNVAVVAQTTAGQVGAPRTLARPSKPIPSKSTGSANAPKLTDLVDELWSKITIGSLVIAPEDDRDDGWWEAIVVDRRGNTLTLRWRDFPKLPLITRKLKDLALLHPKASV